MKDILFIAIISTLVSCNPSSSSKSEVATGVDDILDQFEYQLQKDIEDDNLNGSISLAIVKGDKVLRSKAFGEADLNHHAADTSTIYRIGSVTKSFTSLLMMQLAQEGIIQIGDPIEKYLPEIRGLVGYSDSTKITFGQLASHTSGLHSGPNYGKPANATVKEWESLLLKCIPATSFGSRPGRRYSYSNIGFAILGLALSRAADKPYMELIQTRIFNPLHMSNSFFLVPEERQSDLAQGRWGPMGEVDDVRPQEDHTNIGWSVANGGIFSTSNDLTKFMFSMMGYSDILNDDYLEMMQTTQTPEGKWNENYGYGVAIYQDSIISTIGHQGGNPGYRANFLFEKETKYGVILLRNYSWGITDLNLRSTVLLRKLNEFEVKSKF
ncbi:MAG: serine hydrolase domain-containing protein [Cyclobacteriaceae bacterium]